MLFWQYFDDWVETYKKSAVRPATLAKYANHGNHLRRIAPGLLVGDVDRKAYQRILNEFAKDHAKNTVLDFHNAIKAAILDAVDDGLLARSPCRKVAIGDNRQARRKEKFLNAGEAEKLLAALDLGSPVKKDRGNRSKRAEAFRAWLADPEAPARAIAGKLGVAPCKVSHWKNYDDWAGNRAGGTEPEIKRAHGDHAVNVDWMVYLALKTGLRYAELLALTPADFDFGGLTLAVTKTMDYKLSNQVEKRTKSRSSTRTIAISQDVAGRMQDLVSGHAPGELIFAIEGQRNFNSTANKRLETLCRNAGVTPVSFHGLRHSHASYLLYKGVSIHGISKRLGHSKASVTQDVYAHVIDELKEKDDGLIRGAL